MSSDEYKGFEKHLLYNTTHGYDNNEIDLFEFVVETRLKDILKQIPLGQHGNESQSDKHREITWKQLIQLKYSIAYFLQTQSLRAINDKNYDIKDFMEKNPLTKYDPKDPKFFKEEVYDSIIDSPESSQMPAKSMSLVKKLKAIVNIMRNIVPESKMSDELRTIYDGFYDNLRSKVPPNSKMEKRKSLNKKMTIKNLINVVK